MKKVLMITLVMVLSAGAASAQVGNIGLFADVNGTDCVIEDGAGLITFYAVHVLAVCATACSYAAVVPACWTGGLWLSDTPQFGVTIGNSQTGVNVGYGSQLGSPINTLAINVFGAGTTATCCVMTVTPAPGTASGQIEVVDCNNDLFQIGTSNGSGIISNVATNCPCNVATEESTWGAVKNIYSGQQ